MEPATRAAVAMTVVTTPRVFKKFLIYATAKRATITSNVSRNPAPIVQDQITRPVWSKQKTIVTAPQAITTTSVLICRLVPAVETSRVLKNFPKEFAKVNY